MDSLLAQESATMLESLLDDETHRLNLGTSLPKVHHALRRITIGKEVIDKDNMVLRVR